MACCHANPNAALGHVSICSRKKHWAMCMIAMHKILPDILMARGVDIGVITSFAIRGLSQPVALLLCIELLVESDGEFAGLQVASLTQELGNTRALLDYHQYHHKQISRAHGEQRVELRNLRSAHR